MDKLLIKLQNLVTKQKVAMTKMSKEKCDDIHSVLRSKDLAMYIIELETKIDTLREVIVLSSTNNLSGGGFQNSGEWETDGLSGFRG